MIRPSVTTRGDFLAVSNAILTARSTPKQNPAVFAILIRTIWSPPKVFHFVMQQSDYRFNLLGGIFLDYNLAVGNGLSVSDYNPGPKSLAPVPDRRGKQVASTLGRNNRSAGFETQQLIVMGPGAFGKQPQHMAFFDCFHSSINSASISLPRATGNAPNRRMIKLTNLF